MEWITNIITWLSNLRKMHLPIIGICVASAGLLLLPEVFLQRIHLADFVKENGQWVGLTFYASSALLLCMLGSKSKSFLQNLQIHRRRRRFLQDLSPPEMRALRRFILGRTKSVQFHVADGTAGGLLVKGILYRATSIGTYISGFDLNIHEWAWAYLNRNPQLIMTEHEREAGFEATVRSYEEETNVIRSNAFGISEPDELWPNF